ncbi:predicted protein [Postia placenta Mad-698-R]|nr:predicted protein [Postia placenta Mad-698-R]
MLMKKGGIVESDVFAGATKTQPIVLDQAEGLSKKQKITLGKSVLMKQNGTLKMFANWYILMVRILPAEEAHVGSMDQHCLEEKHDLIYLMDGWEDALKQSVYGYLIAQLGEHPIVLCFEDMSGEHATAPLACFMHGINTIMGKIMVHPLIKAVITKNTCIVTFFNASVTSWSGTNSSVSALQWAVLVLTDAWIRSRAPPLPLPITVADEFFDCSRLEHAFDTQEQIDVSRDDPESDGNQAPFFICDRQPCPNRTPRSITTDEGRYVPIRRVQHPCGPALRYAGTSRSTSRHVTPVPSRPASPGTRIPQPVTSTGQARGDPSLPRGVEAVAQSTATPQTIPQSSLGSRLERNPKPEPSNSPAVTWASSSSAISSSTPVPVVRHPATGLPPSPPPPSPPRGRSSTRSSRSSPGGQSQQPSSPVGSPPSPSSSVMSSPVSPPDKDTLKLLLPLRYDGKTVIECDRFLSQLRIYWLVNTSLTTIELKVQVALSLLDGDARTWATPYFAQLVSVQLSVQGVTTPFANEAAFATAFKACFGNLDDEAAA